MPGPLSEDLRSRVVRAVVDEGLSRRAAASRFKIGIRTAVRWVSEWRERGHYAPLPMGNPRPPKLSAYRQTVLDMLAADPDITIEGLRHALAEVGIAVGYGSIRRFFKREGITRKKRH